MSTKSKLFLVGILILGSLLRFYNLGQVPIHLTNDEAALGYNAYSILKTGRDEHGQLLPIVFQSFGDWKPGLYVYLTLPSIAIFGLNEFAVRFPSAFLGVVSVFLVYLIGKKLFNEKVGLFTALSFALMPWSIHFSRGAWEANAALALLLGGVWFFLISLEKSKFILPSALLFGLTLWTYQSAKLASFLPLLALALVYLVPYLQKGKAIPIKSKHLFQAILVGVVVSVPIASSLFTGKGGRLEVMSVFSYTRPEEYIKETILDQEQITKSDPLFTLFHSETFNLSRGVAGRYFNYFSGRFLLFEGDWSNPKHTSPNSGYLLYASIPILLVGAASLMKQIDKKGYKFVFLWLLLAPIPAALTRDSAHGVRALDMAAPIAFVLGLGLYNTFNYLSKQKFYIKYFFIVSLVAMHLYSMAIYLDAYFIQNPVENAEEYSYGYKQIVEKVNEVGDKYQKIVFDQSYEQPYIFFLFFNKYDPALYQENSSYTDGVNGDVGFVQSLGKIEFRPINWSADKSLKKAILIGKEPAFPLYEFENKENFSVESIKYPNGNNAFLIVEPLI